MPRTSPLYAATYTYVDRPAELAAVRPEHRTYLDRLATEGKLLASGPLGSATEPIGALIILDAESAEAAAALLDGDPFAAAGFIAERTIQPWTPVLGQWS